MPEHKGCGLVVPFRNNNSFKSALSRLWHDHMPGMIRWLSYRDALANACGVSVLAFPSKMEI